LYNSRLYLKNKLLNQSFFSLVVKSANILIGLGLSIIFTRMLSQEDFGIYSYAVSLMLLVTVVVQFGFPTFAIRETSKNLALKQPDKLFSLWKCLQINMLSLSIISIICLFAGFQFFNVEKVYYWGIFLIPLLSLERLYSAILRGMGYISNGLFAEHIIRPGLLLVMIFLLYLLNINTTVENLMIMHVFSAVIALIFAFSVFTILKKRQVKIQGEYRCLSCNPRHWYSKTSNFAFARFASQLNAVIGVILLGFYEMQNEVAIFKISQQVAMIVIFGSMVIDAAFSPYFSSLHSLGELNKLKKLVKINTWISFSFAMLSMSIIVFYGEKILELLFGVEYIAAYSILIIIATGQLVSASFGPVAVLLGMVNLENRVFHGLLISVVINLGLGLLLVKSYGIVGVSVALLFSITIYNIFLWRVARLNINIDTFVFSVRG